MSERRTITRSFVESCRNRINERSVDLVERSKQAQTSNGRELVIVKDAAIKAFMKDNNISLRAPLVVVGVATLTKQQAAPDEQRVTMQHSGVPYPARLGCCG